jgi:hypothetical protein
LHWFRGVFCAKLTPRKQRGENIRPARPEGVRRGRAFAERALSSYNIKIQWCRAAFRAEQLSRTTCGPFLPLSCSPHPHLRIISCSRRGRTMRVRPPFLFQFTFHRRALWTRTAARSPRRAAEAEARPLTASCAHHRALASTTSQATWVPGATGLPPASPLRIGGVVMGEVFLKAAWWAPSFLPAPPLAPW